MAGRPCKTFSKAIIAKIDRYARAQARDGTIADALGISRNVFKAHFRTRCRQKRAEGKLRVLEAQYLCALKRASGHSGDRVWWGKQHLDQKDRQKSEIQQNVKIDAPVITFESRQEATDAPPAES